MSTISKTTTYEQFSKAIIDKVIEYVSNEANSQAICNYRYSGFSISVIYEEFLRIVTEAKLTDEQIASDLTNLLGLYFVRGPNTNKITADNTIGSATSFSTIQNLIKKYGLQLNKANAKTITLVRLVMVFPVPAYNIYKNLKPEHINYPITESEIGLPKSQIFSLPFIPSFLAYSDLFKDSLQGVILVIYNIYQSHLSYRTKKNMIEGKISYSTKDPLENFPEATKYSLLASHGSLSSTEGRNAFFKDQERAINEMSKSILTAFEIFCRRPPTVPCNEMPTKFHILHNISWKRGTPVKDLECKTDIIISFAF